MDGFRINNLLLTKVAFHIFIKLLRQNRKAVQWGS